MAPAGHVTVVIVPAPAPELHAVEYRPCEDVTDGLAGREADTERLADTEMVATALTPGDTAEREGEAEREAVRDTLAQDEDEREAEAEREAVSEAVRDTLAQAEDEREGEAERDEDGLADALTSLHCT